MVPMYITISQLVSVEFDWPVKEQEYSEQHEISMFMNSLYT